MFLVSLLQKWLWCRVFYVLFSTYCTLLCFTYYSQRTALYYVLRTILNVPHFTMFYIHCIYCLVMKGCRRNI